MEQKNIVILSMMLLVTFVSLSKKNNVVQPCQAGLRRITLVNGTQEKVEFHTDKPIIHAQDDYFSQSILLGEDQRQDVCIKANSLLSLKEPTYTTWPNIGQRARKLIEKKTYTTEGHGVFTVVEDGGKFVIEGSD